MAPPSDARKTVGAVVHAKACHVRSLAECSRRYGSAKETKLVRGAVTEAYCNSSGQRASWSITADFEFGGGERKRKSLNIRSVYAGELPATVPPVTSPPGPLKADSPAADVGGDGHHRQAGMNAYSVPAAPVSTPEAAKIGPVFVHDTTWVEGDDHSDVQAPLTHRAWRITTASGQELGPGGDHSDTSPLDYFLMMFPTLQLRAMVRMTNSNLHRHECRLTSSGELLKFLGMLILITRFEFGNCSTLWSSKKPGKYAPASCLGTTGMARDRFDILWRYVRFSDQPDMRPSDISSDQYRWRLVDDFVARFNAHRVSNFSLSGRICVDESMSKWYGNGGFWINMDLPQYIAIERKPENGCEIRNSACGRSKIMMRLKLEKTAKG